MSNAPEYDGYLKADPYARKSSIPGSSPYSRGSVSRQVNKVRQVSMLPSQKSSSLERAISKIDLSHLSEEERAKVLNVVQRDLQVRVVEKERLKRYRTSLLRRDREVAAKSQALAESYNCLLCGQKFILLINPRMQCKNCGRQICRRCSETVTEVNGPLCRLCLRETGYRAMRCNWFYDTVISRFREFGSTAVAKSIFGDKYQQIQNIAEDELANIISMYGSNENDGDVIVNEQKVPSQSLEKAKDVQLKRLRTKLEGLMQNTMKEFQLVDQDRNLTDQQKYWQGGRIGLEFRKAAATQLRSFTQTFYITTERQRSSQGNSSRNVTQYVMNTLQQEVSQIVGHPIKDIEDNLSLASDDDLESVAYAEREGIEELLAQALLDKVLRDRQYYASGVKKELSKNSVYGSKPVPDIKGRLASKENPSRSSTPSSIDSTGKSDEKPYLKCEQITVEEGTPTRLEMKVDFNENCEFSWLKENDSGIRTQVKCDFHCEHVITGTSDPEGQDYFVLSNSGHFGAEATERLLKTNKLLKQKRAPYGVVVQHQLIFWATKLEDTGKYFAVARTPAGSGTFAVTEAQYLLTVQPASKWPIHPKHSPDFIQPLAIVFPIEARETRCLELMCTVASNPAPRCLFYRNNTPIPVVIMPLLTNEDDKQDLCLSSFSRKFTVVSSPDRDAKAPMSIGYLRKLLLRINSPMAEDAATYTCRAWNVHGRVETSTNVTSSDIQKGTSLWLNGSLPRSSLSERIEQTQNGVLNSAKEIQKTAQTHGDILGQYGRTSSREQISPLRSQIPTEEELADLHAQYARRNPKQAILQPQSPVSLTRAIQPNPPDLYAQYPKVNSKPPMSPTRSQPPTPSPQERLNEAVDKTLDLYSRVIELQRRFYSHSCSSQQPPSSAPHKPRSKTIGSPFILCMGQKQKRVVRAYGRNDARDRSSTCEELRTEMNHLVEDVFSNEQMIQTIHRDEGKPLQEQNQPRTISIIRAPELEYHRGVSGSSITSTQERSWSAESHASGSSITTNGGSFTRQSSRRSSGPRLVVDRRSQRRKQTAKIQQSEAYGKPM
ncbi:hypothetical protein CRM22_008758 [Opisthorchis felineus]|uniref:Rab effector MyRIP n=1 Tax=Opisthorchis felineus TaxID=147828 RepID=A0A4S2LHS2_OPIFE|nr:hypothetical protein CRM22_008758 [Opisthorchis felineus]